MSAGPDVLVVGAGPTGLALALQAHAHGARVRIVDRRPEAFRASRALIVHARTLEVLRPLGVVDALLARADIAPSVRLHLGSRVVPVALTDLALADTAYPHLTLLRQMEVETVLARALADRGIEVERGTELIGLCPGGAAVTLRSPRRVETTTAGFVAGCDGAGSTVRGRCGIGWRGRPYRQEVVLADVELDGDLAPGVSHIVAARGGLLFLFAQGEQARWRLLATRRAGGNEGASGRPVPVDELRRLVAGAGLDARIASVAWSDVVRLQHRIADRYRAGRVFLAGDAAHVHSPAGGQGMNTGIQDAVNLGWKLALARHSAHPERLLDSYEQERRPVARRVRAVTNLVFWAEAGTDPLASFGRAWLAPLGAPVVPLIMRQRTLIAQGVRMLSQLRIGYRASPLSVNATSVPHGAVRAGDRLPDATVTVDGQHIRLHELLARPGVHVLVDAGAGEPDCDLHRPLVHLHRLAGMPGHGLVAVRPDGYVGLRARGTDDRRLVAWLDLVGAGERSPQVR